jgi:GntR family transcriptional regulator
VAERGRGSRIDRSRIDQPLGTLYSVFREVEARGMEQSSRVLRLEPTKDADAATELRLAPDADLIVLERVRYAGTEPLAFDTAWLPAGLAQPLLGADLARASLYDKLARRCGARVDSGRERIRPIVANQRQAELLQIPLGTAAFYVERLGCVGDRPVEWRCSVVRGDRFAFVAEWSVQHPDLELSAEPVPAAGTMHHHEGTP